MGLRIGDNQLVLRVSIYGLTLAGFLLGVFIGKLAALCRFVVASTYLRAWLQESTTLVNRFMSAILLFIGFGFPDENDVIPSSLNFIKNGLCKVAIDISCVI